MENGVMGHNRLGSIEGRRSMGQGGGGGQIVYAWANFGAGPASHFRATRHRNQPGLTISPSPSPAHAASRNNERSRPPGLAMIPCPAASPPPPRCLAHRIPRRQRLHHEGHHEPARRMRLDLPSVRLPSSWHSGLQCDWFHTKRSLRRACPNNRSTIGSALCDAALLHTPTLNVCSSHRRNPRAYGRM